MPDPRPTIAISMGDPLGIGPEVIVKALADPARRRRAHHRVLGSGAILSRCAERAGIEPYWWRLPHRSTLIDTALTHDVLLLDYDTEAIPGPHTLAVPHHSRWGGELSFRFVEDAIADARRPRGDPFHADAIVTAPISKASWKLAGHGAFPGHTELLAARAGVKRFAMMFDAPELRVILATTHVPLAAVPDALTIGRVHEAIDLGHEACQRLGVGRPRIAVCGLNPHAGEQGLLGDEDSRIIAPAIAAARDTGIDARGPFPADTLFTPRARAGYDLVVAMYHDQGLIPLKMLAFDHAVNMTVGLPFIRTSPDHGTAFDIAEKNMADPRSMGAAIDLAVRMARPVPS